MRGQPSKSYDLPIASLAKGDLRVCGDNIIALHGSCSCGGDLRVCGVCGIVVMPGYSTLGSPRACGDQRGERRGCWGGPLAGDGSHRPASLGIGVSLPFLDAGFALPRSAGPLVLDGCDGLSRGRVGPCRFFLLPAWVQVQHGSVSLQCPVPGFLNGGGPAWILEFLSLRLAAPSRCITLGAWR